MPEEKRSTRLLAAANTVLAGAGIICLLALSYFVYHYSWTGDRQFARWTDILARYGAPAWLSILLFACLKLAPRYRVIVAGVFLSLAAFAYGLETVVQFSEPLPSVSEIMLMPTQLRRDMAAKLTQQSGIHIDTRDEEEVIADFRRQGVEAISQLSLPAIERQTGGEFKVAVRINGLEAMPLAGPANRMTVVCNQNGQYLTYLSDEHGFHNPNGIWDVMSNGVLAVGNSLTLGYCVASDKNFVALIRQRLPATLNLGMPGEGPLQILAVLREYGVFIKPKVVLWFYAEANSLSELQREKQSLILMRYLRRDFTQNLFLRQNSVDQAMADKLRRGTIRHPIRNSRPLPAETKFPNRLVEWTTLSKIREKIIPAAGTAPEEGETLSEVELQRLKPELNLLGRILAEAKSRVSAWGGALYFVYLPSWERYANVPSTGVKARNKILTLVDTLGIPLINGERAFEARRDPLSFFPFRKAGHFNEQGHRAVGDLVLSVIERR